MIVNEPISAGDDIDMLALMRTAWNYRIFIALVTLACGIIAVVFALIATPIYRSEIVITEVRDSGMGGGASIMGQLGGLASLAGVNLGANSPGREARAVLQSRNLVEEFIKRYELLPELYAKTKKPPTMWLAVKEFREGVLGIREDTRKGTITVTVNWTNPIVAARWANDFVALVNEVLRTRAVDEAKRNIKYLNEQIALTNVVELQRVMYNLVESETKTLMLANVRADYAFAVVDPAVPPEIRVKPKRTVIVLFGLAIGFFVGIGAALTRNALARNKQRTAAASKAPA